MIWDNLPDEIQEKIYKKIVYKQPKNLQKDLISYVNTINLITNRNRITINYTDWDILWCLVLSYDKKDNKEKEKNFNNMKTYILNNYDLMKRYEGAMYWIKRIVKNLSIKEREDFIYSMNER